MTKALAIYGSPGCGKSTELMRRIADFVEQGYRPNEIAFMSHTKAAAAEALSRLNMAHSDKVSTIHSLCYRILGLSSQQLVDWSKLNDFSKLINIPIKNGSVDSEEGIEVGDEYLGILNKARNRLRDPMDEYADSDHPGSLPQFQSFVEGYNNWKHANGFLDFTDMLARFVKRNKNDGFDARVLLVDEAQDLSPLQWSVVRILARTVDHIVIAGDDDQAIYIWGGADPAGMTLFESEYGAERKILTQSHRIPSSVHTVALGIIDQVSSRVVKEYAPRAEAGRVQRFGYLDAVKFQHGIDTLVLCRAGSQKKEVEKHMLDTRTPYLIEGGKPGLYQTKVARAIRVYEALKGPDATMSASDLELLQSQATPKYKVDIKNRDLKAFLSVGYMRALAIPPWMYDFYMNNDVTVQPTIRISSIHGSKGREAERVVLHTGLTPRIVQGMNKSPDEESRVFYVGVTRAKQFLDIVDGDNGYVIR